MTETKERCEDGLCGTGEDWPNCSTDCVCACHDEEEHVKTWTVKRIRSGSGRWNVYLNEHLIAEGKSEREAADIVQRWTPLDGALEFPESWDEIRAEQEGEEPPGYDDEYDRYAEEWDFHDEFNAR